MSLYKQVTRLRLLSYSFEIPLDLEVSLFLHEFLTFACIELDALLAIRDQISRFDKIIRNAVETEWLKEWSYLTLINDKFGFTLSYSLSNFQSSQVWVKDSSSF